MAERMVLGVLGGSGLYDLEHAGVHEHEVKTPFGEPSDAVVETTLAGHPVFFLSRHGRGHRFSPSEIPYRANIYALKSLGVTHILAVSAVGILGDGVERGDFVIPDQIYDRTKGQREGTFFSDGICGHAMYADPFCDELRSLAGEVAESCGARVHRGGTYLCMEGPRFSTRAESLFYREKLGARVIGMTAIPEAGLAREAEMAYALIATATDFDCWHEEEEDASVVSILDVLKSNAALACRIVDGVAGRSEHLQACSCHEAARYAIITARDRISPGARERLDLFYGRYWR